MQHPVTPRPKRVLMTVDAVGGVWRYAIDLASKLAGQGVKTVFLGLGPKPSRLQHEEAERIGELRWLDLPLDWLARDPRELNALPAELAQVVNERRIDLVHLNLPTQAWGLDLACPVVVASHSCVTTWFQAVRGGELPDDWAWHKERNAAGLRHAGAVLVPTHSHAAMLEAVYGPIAGLTVVPNATLPPQMVEEKHPVVLAAGRWWDEGKNGAVLEAAAARIDWPVLMAGATRGPNGQALGTHWAWALGELPSGQLRGLMSNAAIVASPSIYEPFGLVALEAAAAGAALVLADIPTYRELWSDAAIFVPPRDPDAWVDAVNRLARDPGQRLRLGRLARERAARFRPAAQVEAVLSAYASAMARFPARRLVA
jgi:glycosyltransferase involved in cell wall biosynthesis